VAVALLINHLLCGYSVCNITSVQDSLQGLDVPDVSAADVLDAFRPAPSVQGSGNEVETDKVERAQVCLPSPHEPSLPAKWRARAAAKGTAAEAGQQQARPEFPRFSMATGDFVEVYTNLKSPQYAPQLGRACADAATGVVFSDSSLAWDSGAGQWDAVVTCFFIDTAPVVLE
jgi:hypothetical protein